MIKHVCEEVWSGRVSDELLAVPLKTHFLVRWCHCGVTVIAPHARSPFFSTNAAVSLTS